MRWLYSLILAAAAAAPLSAGSLQEDAQKLQIPEKVTGDQLPLPKLRNTKVRILCTDYPQVISRRGQVNRLNEDVHVHVSFQLERGKEKAVSKDYVVLVPGKPHEEGNAKPRIIPELLAWKGGTGHFMLPVEITVENSVPFAEDFCKELADVTGAKVRTVPEGADAHINFKSIKRSAMATPESYGMLIDREKGVLISAATDKALYWGTRTLLQMARQNHALPCGIVYDAPRFRLRGMMLDIARLPFPMDYLREVVRTLAWYKMNELHLTLNNNYIFHSEHVKAGQDPFKHSYSAFRLESLARGKDGTALTAPDLYYSKQEFADFIIWAREHNVNIIPEFDTPGHALSFTRVRPDLIYKGPMGKKEDCRCEMLDAANPETLKFAGSVMDEYLLPRPGRKPVMEGCVIHVGADEFFGDKEHYRQYADGILNYVLKRGYTPRIWGSLYAKPGNTPVVSKGVQMNIWSKDWGRAWQSINQGYSIINTHDNPLYIVPEANYYRMDRNHQKIYNTWVPSVIGPDTVPAGHPQLLGATFAIWNDMTDRHYNGYGAYDIRNIITDTLRVLSQKMWGRHRVPHSYDEHVALGRKLGHAPLTDPDFRAGAEEIDVVPDVLPHKLHAGSMGPDYHVTMDVTLPEAPVEGEEQVLLQSDQGKFFAAMKDGTIGFRRSDSMEFSFACNLPVGKKVRLELIGRERETQLLIDGQPAGKIWIPKFPVIRENLVTSFVLPLEVLGGSFKGTIHHFNVRPSTPL